jgi:hypothetical protein
VKKAKKSEKSEKSEKIDLNFASLCFASKQKLLNRSEAKNLKRKKTKKCKTPLFILGEVPPSW